MKGKGNESTVPQNTANVFLRQTRSREREVDHYAAGQGLYFAVTSDRMSSCVLLNVLRVWLKFSLKQCLDLWGNETLEISKFYGFLNKIVFFIACLPILGAILENSLPFSYSWLSFLWEVSFHHAIPLPALEGCSMCWAKLHEYLGCFPRCPVCFISTLGQML